MTLIALKPTSPPGLTIEAAIAARIIHSGKLPRELFRWLNAPTEHRACPLPFADEAVCTRISEIVHPMLADARHWEAQEAQHASGWLGAVCRCAAEHIDQLHLKIGIRVLAASLLPLYRSLATGNLHEGLQQSRFRLSELLAMLALCHEVGSDLVDVLDSAQGGEAPTVLLRTHLDLDLILVATIVRDIVSGFDTQRSRFSESSNGALLRIDRSVPGPAIADWATPEPLWKLAGEMLTKNSKLLLPRSWVETPVPWTSITKHWHNLAKVLASTEQTRTAEASPNDSSTEAPKPPLLRDFVMPKLLMAEVLSHNDPVFVSYIGRQITVCRSEGRSLSLASIVVQPENEVDCTEIRSSREDGLTLWQQKLVNWLVDHPHVSSPHAFFTTTGELLLCLLDLERHETTALLRRGLIETLSGQTIDEGMGNVIARVHVPARYHVGIASKGSPGANFTPEQLIEPAIRCLSAASRQGKAAIKSIEAF